VGQVAEATLLLLWVGWGVRTLVSSWICNNAVHSGDTLCLGFVGPLADP